MTFACSGDGEPLYWKPLLLSTRRSPRLRSVQRVALLLFLLVSHCACGTSFLAGPERSMVTGGISSTNSNNNNNNNNKDIHNNNDNNKVHNHIHNTNGNGNDQQQQQQQRHSHLPYQQQSQQQQQDSDTQLQQQLQHSLQPPQSHYYYHQYKQPQSHTYQQKQQTQHQPSEQKSSQQSQQLQQQQTQQKQQQSSPSQQQQQQQPQSQRQKRQDKYSEVRGHLWPKDTRETCNNNTLQQPPSPGPPAPSVEAPSQCLLIDHDFSKDICEAPTAERKQKMRNARLAFCDSYLVYNTVNKECRDPSILPQPKCEHCFEKLERLDAEVSDNYAVFEDILSRYDCETTFSTHWNCSHCKVAYKHWVCSMAFRYHTDKGVEVPPCRVYCEEVENKCPYFLPELHNQYAGEPSFLCRDSVRDRQTGVLPKPEGRCYKPCPTGNEICIQNATETATHKDVTDSRTPNVTSGHTNDTSQARGERSRSSSAKSLQGSIQTLWLNLAAQLGMVLWSSRTLSLYWVIGLT